MVRAISLLVYTYEQQTLRFLLPLLWFGEMECQRTHQNMVLRAKSA